MHLPPSWSSNVYAWRGRLIVAGESPNSEWYIAQVKDGKLNKVNLGEKGLLPSRPVRLDEVHGSFENDQAVPVFTVDLKDDRTAFVSGILDKNGDLSVLLQNKDEGTFAAQDRAGARFAKVFGFNNAKLVRENGNYPEEASFYNANENHWGAAVPTPKPVYQASVFLLNDEEVLIAGSTAEDELNGSVIGYVFNEKSGQFQDASALLEQLSYENLKNSDTEFYKNLGSDVLYYRGEIERQVMLRWDSRKLRFYQAIRSRNGCSQKPKTKSRFKVSGIIISKAERLLLTGRSGSSSFYSHS